MILIGLASAAITGSSAFAVDDTGTNNAATVFRFAPSPNGYLHLGHALSALLNADMARAAGGEVLLRIEDIDATRCRPEYEAAIYEDLAWLGLALHCRCASNPNITTTTVRRWPSSMRWD